MLGDVLGIISSFGCVEKRRLHIISGYIFFLSVVMKRHSYKAAGEITGVHGSRFSTLLNDPATEKTSQAVLSRAVRRRLKKLKSVEGRVVIVIDATIKKRRGKGVENARRYHSGSGLVMGHKFVNFVALDGQGGVVPIDSLPAYTKPYCRENGIKYQTEIEIVEAWLKELQGRNLFTEQQIRSAIFLLDSGYDAKPIQRAIGALGGTFVMALKSSRTVGGKQVRELFRASRRWLAWESIRLKAGAGGRGSRRNYSIRTARDIAMKGFGLVNVVCSKADHNRKKPRKYLCTNCLAFTGREIVKWYTMRWRIETWHREMKQNYGFIDCHAGKFTAQAAHINFSLTAYLLQKESGSEQMRIEEYVRRKELREINGDLTKFGAVVRLKKRVTAALAGMAA